ncbi:MAG: GNAT family N-acetyltransferase [Ginsengibacter sp.]
MFELQPTLEDDLLIARPLKDKDVELLYKAASDPFVWDQHPNKNRYQRDEFLNFFKGAMQSGGAFAVIDKESNTIIGSSRFYDLNENDQSVFIGYTFFEKKYWGKNYNHSLKKLMIDHAFQFVDKIHFHIGATNYRSQKSIEKLGAKKIGEQLVEYFGEEPRQNFVYEIKKVEK